MSKPKPPEEFLPLPTASLHILLAVRDRERHGYAIMQEVDRLSEGSVKMGPGTLYGTIKRLLASGLIEETTVRPDPELDDERRRYYRLTQMGATVCAAEVDRLTKLISKAALSRWEKSARPKPGEA